MRDEDSDRDGDGSTSDFRVRRTRTEFRADGCSCRQQFSDMTPSVYALADLVVAGGCAVVGRLL